ncbi:MAG: adenylate kinase [candidate division Zixibacteria bacterium SM23_73_3]|nr:MAG: adenylate kinase [candidate division Zixibacteria bacterium SM23_73_3]
MNLILLGAPGSGKGTLAKLLSSKLRVPHISPGDILREGVKQDSPLGQIAKPFMTSGSLVPDEIIMKMMEKRIIQPDCGKGFILDGFPRTIVQAERLDQMLSNSGRSIDFALKFEVSDECALERLGGRRICSVCDADFNLYTKPPKKENVCDICGGKLFQRADDKEEVISNRVKVYREQTLPIEEYYNHQGKLIRINSEPNPNVVLKEILKVLEVG